MNVGRNPSDSPDSGFGTVLKLSSIRFSNSENMARTRKVALTSAMHTGCQEVHLAISAIYRESWDFRKGRPSRYCSKNPAFRQVCTDSES